MSRLASDYPGVWRAILEAFAHLPFWFAIAGVASAWLTCVKMPAIRTVFSRHMATVQRVLIAKYGFDIFNLKVIVPAVRWAK